MRVVGIGLLAVVGVAGQQCASLKPTFAKLFTYEDFGTYQRVNSTQCQTSYILYPRERRRDDSNAKKPYTTRRPTCVPPPIRACRRQVRR